MDDRTGPMRKPIATSDPPNQRARPEGTAPSMSVDSRSLLLSAILLSTGDAGGGEYFVDIVQDVVEVHGLGKPT